MPSASPAPSTSFLFANTLFQDQVNDPSKNSEDTFGVQKSAKTPQKAAQDQEDYEAQKEHSNSGSNTHSGTGMEYVDRKNIKGDEKQRREGN